MSKAWAIAVARLVPDQPAHLLAHARVDGMSRRRLRPVTLMRGVRCGSHACGHQSRNSWRMAAARVWSYPIPYAIGARIASDYAGRPVLPPSQTVCGFAQGQGRVRQWPRRRPLPAVLEPVGSQRGDRQQFQLATGNVEVGGQDFGRSTAGRRDRSGRIGRGCSSMALECTSAAGGQRGKLQPHPPLVDVDRVERRSRYQVTTCSCSSCSGSGAASRNCMKPGTPPMSSGGHRRSPWTNAG